MLFLGRALAVLWLFVPPAPVRGRKQFTLSTGEPAMADLTQFWRDNPRYDGRYKEPAVFVAKYGTGGQSAALAANAVQQQCDVTIGKDADFIVTSCSGCQTTAATDVAYITTP